MPSTTTLIATLARPAVRFGVSASSVPVGVLGRVMGEQDNDQWPPAVAVEGFQATVLRTAGSLLHDDRLSAEGRLLSEKLDRLRTAEILETEAESKRREAAAKLDAQNAAAARTRKQAAEAATAQKAAAARRAQAQKRKAAEEAAASEAEAQQAREEAEQRIKEQERRAKTAAIATERKAVAKEKAAAAAARKAAAADAKIKATNKARRS